MGHCSRVGVGLVLVLAGCNDTRGDATTGVVDVTGGPGPTPGTDDVDTTSPTGGAVFDLGDGTEVGGDVCTVEGELDAPATCNDVAPPDSFDPITEWEWTGPDGDTASFVIPLVANLTDDNGDGAVDPCDVPDVVVVAHPPSGGMETGHIYVLSGDDGHLHTRIATTVDSWVTPALGDLDGDGTIEIVTVTAAGNFVALAADGSERWVGTATWAEPWGGAIAIADLDGDGTAEIVADNLVVSHEGELEWSVEGAEIALSATTAADLDGAPGLEIVGSFGARHADGSMWFDRPGAAAGFPQIADFDGDGAPEILYTSQTGVSLLARDGTAIYEDVLPLGDNLVGGEYQRPAAVHDFDGDGVVEYSTSSAYAYGVMHADRSVLWQAAVEDVSGLAGGTAFDFLGDGTAEAMYADEQHMFVFGTGGELLLQVERDAGTLLEYPVVADVDDDGAAEILLVSDRISDTIPTLRVIGDAEGRWIGTRRIWNQHTYHVTNVREDGRIPANELPSWTYLDTFRTNAQLEDDGVCMPTPVG